jgi:hypothetical protein
MFILIVIITIPNQAATQVHADGGSRIGLPAASREVSMPVKVIFVGIDPTTVDTNYIKWGFNIPPMVGGEVAFPQPYPTGVVYNVDYSFTFASNDFKSKLLSYLQTIQVTKEGPNPWFYYYTLGPSGYISRTNYFSINYSVYDANKVENWIYSNQQETGGFPSNGWTLMFLNLTELPSYGFGDYKKFITAFHQEPPNGVPHYYGLDYRDADLGYRLRYRDFATGWGAVHRFWFGDLSAGPSFWTYPEELPLQIALEDNHIDLHTSFGKSWFTEYLSDYISQATLNLVTPWFVYPPLYSEKYNFHVHLFDNRTSAEKNEVDIKSTINTDRIKQAFENLVPYSKIDVAVTFENVSNYPALQNVIDSSYKYADSLTLGVEFAQPEQYGVIDARPVYKYFQDNMKTFEPDVKRDRSEQTVPVFVFAFSKETALAFTSKWLIQPIGGVALGDMALIAGSQRDFRRGEYVTPPQLNRGLGLTVDVIHEAGHMLGLTHPHDFGPIGDFSLTVMGYYTWDYTFGQRDRDALRRAHVDQIYMEVQSILGNLPTTASAADSANAIKDQLRDVDAKYSQMDYVSALISALKAENMAIAASAGAAILPGGMIVTQGVASTVYVGSGVALGLLIGVVVAWLVIKRNLLRSRIRATPSRHGRSASSRRKRK